VGKQILADKIDTFVNQGKTVEFVMLGFPFKSTNQRDKVLGKLPDLGEELTVKNFARFNRDVKTVYEPGVDIGIASDGYIFNEVLNERDEVVRDYGEFTRSMARHAEAPLSWWTLMDFYSGDLSAMRAKLLEHWASTPEKLQQEILFNPDTNMLYRGMVRFMEEELWRTRTFPPSVSASWRPSDW